MVGDDAFFKGAAGGALAALLLNRRPKVSEKVQVVESEFDPDDINRIELLGQTGLQLASPAMISPIPWNTVVTTHPAVTPPPGTTHVMAMIVDQQPLSIMQILCISNGAPILPVSGPLVPQVKWMVLGFAPLSGGETVVTGVLSWLRVVSG